MSRTFLAPIVLAAALATGATAAPAAGQAGEPPAPTKPVGTATKVFVVRHVDPRHVASVLEIYGGAARPQTDLRVVAWGGPADRLAAVEATVASLDVAPPPVRDVLLTAWLVAASQQELPGPEPPAAVRTAIGKLSDPAVGRHLRLLDRALLRARANGQGAEIRGLISGLAPGSGSYELRVRHLAVETRDRSQIVRIDGLAFEVETPVSAPASAPERGVRPVGSLSTGLGVALGSTVVVGATPLEGPGQSLLLVLHAALAD